MRLTIDGIPREFMPVRQFRAMHGLPPSFGVAQFEPKDYTGLGSIEGVEAAAALRTVETAVLAALPERLTPRSFLTLIPALTDVFRAQIYAVNDAIRLRPVELDFAAAGFHDALQAYGYALVRARSAAAFPPSFDTVYQEWIESTARASTTVHEMLWNHEIWKIRLVNHAYGRVGMIVTTPREIFYVHDPALACPAEGFMQRLLVQVGAGVRERLEMI